MNDREENSDDETVEATVIDDVASRALWERLGESPLGVREVVSIVLLVVLFDVTVFRGNHAHGLSGYAAWFAAIPVLLWIGASERKRSWTAALVALMLVLQSLRLMWSGNILNVIVGFTLIPTLAMSLAGGVPYVPEIASFTSRLVGAGYRRIACYLDGLRHIQPPEKQRRSLELLLPLGALFAFSVIFVLANPALVEFVSDMLSSMGRAVRDWLYRFSAYEVIAWFVVGWLGFGIMRPTIDRMIHQWGDEDNAIESKPSPLYAPFRNTLFTVIGLFAVYLAFEFSTLWFREFPTGFYYAGYAHEGAAWLTIALALATGMLSWIFRSRTSDPRIATLKKLAWIWSAQNFLLAAAVYNRMFIYIDFNGMTRMRTIGLFGITTVIVGFTLVLIKIARDRSFLWLIHRQLWALAIAVMIFAITPVDYLVHRYNVAEIMSGNLAPSVQISVHPIAAEGYLTLLPLVECDDEKIRDGIRGMLAAKHQLVTKRIENAEAAGWTATCFFRPGIESPSGFQPTILDRLFSLFSQSRRSHPEFQKLRVSMVLAIGS